MENQGPSPMTERKRSMCGVKGALLPAEMPNGSGVRGPGHSQGYQGLLPASSLSLNGASFLSLFSQA